MTRLLRMVLLVVMTGAGCKGCPQPCSTCPQTLPTSSDHLAEGTADITPPATNDVAPVIAQLVCAIGNASCNLEIATDGSTTREVFAGADLGTAPAGTCWNGLGSDGSKIGLAGLCTLRDVGLLSGAEVVAQDSVGPFSIRHALKYTTFDPSSKHFEGLDTVEFAIPGIGSARAIASPFTADLVESDFDTGSICAGSIPIPRGTSIRINHMSEKKFCATASETVTIDTPIGPIPTVFALGLAAQSSSAFPAGTNSDHHRFPEPYDDWWSGDILSMRLADIFGRTAGARFIATGRGTYDGWVSQFGMGNRGPDAYMALDLRPDLELRKPRQLEAGNDSLSRCESMVPADALTGLTGEAKPNIAAGIQAEVHYPASVDDLLTQLQIPQRVRDALDVNAFVYIRLGVATRLWAQFNPYFDEVSGSGRVYATSPTSTKYDAGFTIVDAGSAPVGEPPPRVAHYYGLLSAVGQLAPDIVVGVQIHIGWKSPFGIVSILDLDVPFKIPINPTTISSLAANDSYADAKDSSRAEPSSPANIRTIRSWGTPIAITPEQYLSACLSSPAPPPGNDVEPTVIPDSNRGGILTGQPFPCNSCVAWAFQKTCPGSFPDFAGMMSATTTPPAWTCTPSNNGCYDLCVLGADGVWHDQNSGSTPAICPTAGQGQICQTGTDGGVDALPDGTAAH